MLEYSVLGAVRALLVVRICVVYVLNWLISPFTLLKAWALGSIARGHKKRHMKRLKSTIATTEDYQTWWVTAKRLDLECGYGAWSEDHRTSFDVEELTKYMRNLQRCLMLQDSQQTTYHLRCALRRTLSSASQDELFPYYCGTKKILEQYIVQVINSIEFLYGSQRMTLACRASFFRDTLQAYGRTALILSGGSALGLYHLGVMKALSDAQMLPNVICATELGAALAALVCVRRERDMAAMFSLHDVDMGLYDRLRHDRAAIRARLTMFLHEGSLVDVHNLKAFMFNNFGDITFKEAFDISNRVLNVTAWNVPGAPVVFNHRTTPDVVIWSAVCLSIKADEPTLPLMAKRHNGVLCPTKVPEQRWHRRGQLLEVMADTPLAPLAELFDVNFHIVSQIQTHVVPFLHLTDRTPAVYRTRSLFQRIVSKAVAFALDEVHHQLTLLFWLLNIPVDSSLHLALNQRYQGDLTIVPVGGLEDYLAVLQPPSKEHTEQCVVLGCRRAWPLMTLVMYHSLIERRLEKCLADLKVAMKISDESIRNPHTPTASHERTACKPPEEWDVEEEQNEEEEERPVGEQVQPEHPAP
eukprot:GGOE01025100.1.p1 GENE.GGOE01025100.1~~GGOE01025100.1.p1  ORF type:complete len:583 (-),score=181.55 GGOE01025100.1:393-2141(-)